MPTPGGAQKHALTSAKFLGLLRDILLLTTTELAKEPRVDFNQEEINMPRSYWNFQGNCISDQDHQHHHQLPHWLQLLTTIQHQTRSTPSSCTMHIFLNSATVPLLQWLRETLYPLAWKTHYKNILEEFKEHYPQTWPTSLLLQTHNTVITTVIWGCQDYLPYALMQFSHGIFIHHQDSPQHILTK